MTITCCVPNCREKYKNESTNNICFYSFPNDAEMAEKWIVTLRQQNFIITTTKDTKICSKHFTTDSFNASPRSKKSLKKDAMPTVFEFPVRLFSSIPNKAPPSRKTAEIENDSLLRRYLDAPAIRHSESSSDNVEIPPRQKKRYIGDFKEEDLSRKNIHSEEEFRLMVKKVLSRKNTQIKSLQQTKRRLARKVEELSALVKQLKEK